MLVTRDFVIVVLVFGYIVVLVKLFPVDCLELNIAISIHAAFSP